MSATKIEWTKNADGTAGKTWNPIRARLKADEEFPRGPEDYRVVSAGTWGFHCEHVSPGCKNCYAERMNGRTLPAWGTGLDYSVPNREKVDIYLDETELLKPLHWKKPRSIFPCSMTDMFAEFVTDEMIDRMFAVMALCPQHTFQVLTKRAERMREYFTCDPWPRISLEGSKLRGLCWVNVPLSNVHLGVSVEDQQRAAERIPHLLQTPAAVRWVSYEPALGPVDFTRINYTAQLRESLIKAVRWIAERAGEDIEAAGKRAAASVTDQGMPDSERPNLNVLTGEWFDGWDSGTDGTKLDWIVVGGEFGAGARPFDVAWARDVIAQCKAAGVPVFVKQLGKLPIIGPDEDLREWPAHVIRDVWNGGNGDRAKLLHGKGGDMEEWPADLRVREMPLAASAPLSD